MKRGIVYVATGEPYLREVRSSVSTLRQHMPSVSVTLITDKNIDCPNINRVVIKDDFRYDYGDSIIDLDSIPYQQVIQLDSDTHVCDDISELFDVLDSFDFGAAINPGRTFYPDSRLGQPDIPCGFPLFNSGVLVFRTNDRVAEFVSRWRTLYNAQIGQNPRNFNQPTMRKALFESNVRLFPLPPQYNCFIPFPGLIAHDPKIIHGRHPAIRTIERRLSEPTGPRTFHNSRFPIHVIEGPTPGNESLWYKFRTSVTQVGFVPTIQRGVHKITDLI